MDWHAQLHDFALVALAGGLGAVIGIEREFWDKPAGLRTHVFVCAGSALLVLLGEGMVAGHASDKVQADPVRVIQAIVIGIGFLGAGTISHQGGDRVEGLTTAASIYLTAAIGIAVAISLVALAVATTVFAVTVLSVVGWLERRVKDKVS